MLSILKACDDSNLWEGVGDVGPTRYETANNPDNKILNSSSWNYFSVTRHRDLLWGSATASFSVARLGPPGQVVHRVTNKTEHSLLYSRATRQ